MQRHGSMNRIFRLVWSQVLNGWVAVAEGTRGRGKGSRRQLVAAALSLSALHAQAGPAGGQVVAGAGSIARAGALTTITQSSQNLSLNWQSFNVAPQETVSFVQPSASAVAVNRIFDTNGSQILGRIRANGNVYLINPNGILFGPGAQVNVGGLVASTLDLNNAALDGASRTFSGGSEAAVINHGTVTAAPGGHIAFLGKKVINQGSLSAPGGSVALAAGNSTTLSFQDNRLVGVQVDQSVLDTLAENGGLIRADGGRIVLTAGARDALLASTVNNTGVIQARTVEQRNGEIVLLGGMAAGSVHVGGTVDASAPGGGDGGFIETSGARVRIADAARLTTAAPAGRAGTWLVDPVDFTIAASGGDMSGATLGASLANGNVAIHSIDGNAGTAGDVNVNDVVAWSANKLTLNAQRDININANLNGSGSASLALEFGQGAPAAGNTGKTVVHAAVNLPAGPNYSTRQGDDGVVKDFTVITSLGSAADAAGAPATPTLQGMAALANLATNYALGADIDAAATLNWNGYTGFTPIGNVSTQYSGTFDGLGHAISDLSLRPNFGVTDSYVGLFGWTSPAAAVRNVGLARVAISQAVESRTGGLIGRNDGRVVNVYATGYVLGNTFLGGLVGFNSSSGSISESYYAGVAEAGNRVGGIAGVNAGSISNSYSTGSVRSRAYQDLIGGLVGSNSGSITNSYAASTVSQANSDMGALVGGNSGTISNSYWDTSVSALAGVGSGSAAGASGLTAAQMKRQANFAAWDFGNTWLGQDGLSYPLLRAFMKPLTVTANSISKPYDGLAYDGSGGVAYSVQPGSGLAGTLNYGSASQNVLGAGAYAITPGGLYSTQQGYLINYASGTLTVTPAALSLNGTRVYDGGTAFAATSFGAGGVINTGVGTETLQLTGTGSIASKDVAAGLQVLDLGSLALGSGTGQAANYTLAGGAPTGRVVARALTASVAAPSKVYDGGTAARATLSITSGLVSGETVTATGAATFNSKNVAQANLVTVNSVALADGSGGGLASNYALAPGQSVAAAIDKADLAVSGLLAGDRTYDSTLAAPLSGTAFIVPFGGDDVAIGGTAVGVFADKHAGSGKAVTVTGNTLSGTDAGNYNLIQQAGLVANVSRADLAVSGLGASNRTYDATTAAALTGTATVIKLGSDDVAVGGTAAGAFADKNVGTGKAVTVSGNTLSGTDAGNYNLIQQSGLVADIAKADLMVSGLAASNKTYDATTAAVLTGIATIGRLGSDDVTVGGTAAGTFADKNVGAGKAVTVAGNTLSGTDAGNYTLVQQAGLVADVARADLAVSGLAASNKVYDGTIAATLTGTATISRFGTDDVTLGGAAAGVFADKNVGTGKTVTVNGQTLSGADAANYKLVQQAGLVANVAPAELAVNGLAASDKVYDATTAATLTGTATIARFGTDDVTLGGTAAAAFADKNVGTGKAVTVTGNTLSGADAGNYRLLAPVGLTAAITKADLAVGGQAALDKVYDGSDAASLAGNASVAALGRDSVALAGTAGAAFDSGRVGNAKAVTVSGYSLSGADAGNYRLVPQSGLRAAVTPALLTYTAAPASLLVGRDLAALSGSVNGFVAGDTLVRSTTGTLTWTTPAGPRSAVGAYPINGGGLSAPNYVLVQAASNAGALTILPAMVPQPVIDAVAQLLASVRPAWAGLPAPMGKISPAAMRGTVPNTALAFGASGTTTLNIINGGTRLPDNLASDNE